ncbi:Reticulon-like protein-like protein [Hapsidospora chrysogenum ATCC 11550]|uniref:Reticulon-like protein n=1 Tax=Hapsidospora chrysogenum (strain ATCC 11550 / CBS 779.69 / DSM 880 / IAM 14645 / JCM 23072 / IMI 49137) TaxID=857340 RepID=A0A086TEA9_HAPC1|nr:Reticulon-like protein-like protein [Hapsidospora chrysogenum ATCC 11550]
MADSSGSVLETTKASPVAQGVKDHTARASSELSNLAASRKTPTNTTATGQPLTHYHSFFHELLSWNNPRASAIALVSTITLILVARYVDVTRYALKLSWMALGVTVAAEVAGKLLFNSGFVTQLRPRKYMTVSRDTIDGLVGDVHELINFVVIEAQRILYVENVAASVAAAVFSFIGYHLTKLVPYWGLAVIGTVLAFVLPLIYVTNKELIDHHLKNASEAVEAQTAQVRTLAQKQTEQVTALGKQYAGDYTGKVQEMLRGRTGSPAPAPEKKEPQFPSPPTDEPEPVKIDAPDVPEEPIPSNKEANKEEESLI